MAFSRRSIAALHKRQVARGEKRVAKALAEFFRQQVSAALEALDSSGVPSVDQVFQAGEWEQRLREIMFPEIGRLIVAGAASEFKLHGRQLSKRLPRKSSKATPEVSAIFATQPPDWLLEATSEELEQIFSQSFWLEISLGTREGIQEILNFGIGNGMSIRDIRQQIQTEFGNEYSRARATAVARTEVSAAMNFGHFQGMKRVAEDGLLTGKEWLSVLGSTTRPEHAAADGQQVAIGASFIVGGESARFPGDYSLSAWNRVHCQCAFVSTGLADNLN